MLPPKKCLFREMADVTGTLQRQLLEISTEDPRMPEVVTISHPKGYRWQKRYLKMFATQKNCLLREMADINSVPVDQTSQNPLARRNPRLATDLPAIPAPQ